MELSHEPQRNRMIDPQALPRADASKSAAAGYNIDKAVLNGIRSASRATGVDFGYLMAQAAQESSFQSGASAASSSAKGLYQFVDSTWLQMMRDHGAKYGYGALAQQITTGSSGAPAVADPALRQRILDLRSDPKLAATLGAEYARGNKLQLEQALDRPARAADLYMAHFLGPAGAADFLKALSRDGSAAAASLFPKAAAANQNVFYNADGKARSLRAIYDSFDRSITSKASAFAALGTGDAVVRDGARYRPGNVASLDNAGLLPGMRAFAKPMLSLSSVAALALYEALGHLKMPDDAPAKHTTLRS